MATDLFKIRPRYDEVDQMGYVYHAHYIAYCHQARTEMFRKYGVCDKKLEENGIMLPVVTFNISYLKPGHYDEVLSIETHLADRPGACFEFEFNIFGQNKRLLARASSKVAIVDASTRKPIRPPALIVDALFQKHQILIS
jgi:acyl-CoA thioester hydrolase